MRNRLRSTGVALGLALSLLVAGKSRAWTDATTSATAQKSQVEIRGMSGNAIHTHGGAPAQLGHASYTLVNHSKQPHRISIADIEFLQGLKDCDHPPEKVRSHPKSGGILLEDGKQRESAPQVELKAGATVVATVGFTAVPAYYVHCDRFAFRVHFVVDGEKVAVIDEINVTREEPLHEPHK